MQVFLEGNIGAGKTTLLDQIARYYGDSVEVQKETIGEWQNFHGVNLLEKFYANPSQNCFLLQSYILLTMAKSELRPSSPKKLKFFERSIHSSFRIFCQLALRRQNLSNEQFQVLAEWYQFLVSRHRELMPDLVVYLRCSPEIAKNRISKRGRKEESTISISYLEELHQEHDSWLCDPRSLHQDSDAYMPQGERPLDTRRAGRTLLDLLGANVPVLLLDANSDSYSLFARLKQVLDRMTGRMSSMPILIHL